jgi:2-polyprenyl-6-methoxyphenol hydroxylase-like FAD-dependent oxidoreductase
MLARTGVAVEVIEREPAWRDAGTGIYLPGNAARALRALGLEAQVASRAVEIARQRFYDHRGRLLFEVDVAELWAAVGACLALHRAELHMILSDAAGDVPIRPDWRSSASLSTTASSRSSSATEQAANTISWSAPTASTAPCAG